MKEWFSLRELLGVAGLPGTKQGLIERALREGWKRDTRTTQGGKGHVYHLASLPERAQQQLRDKHLQADLAESDHFKAGADIAARLVLKDQMEERAIDCARIEALKDSKSLPAAAQRRMDSRLSMLRLVETYASAHGLPISNAEFAFAELYNKGLIAVDERLQGEIETVSPRSLRYWRVKVKREGITALAGDYGNRKDAGTLDKQPAMRDLVLAILVKKPHARGTHLLQTLEARFGEAATRGEVKLPNLRTVERWASRWKAKHVELFTAISDPDAWKNKHMVAFGSASEGIERLNQLWELDSTPGDVMLTDGRHTVLGCIDVHPRRLKLHVSKTSKASAVAALLRRSILDWGVPEEAKTDNGQDYISHHVERVFRSLDVQHSLCAPFSPWQKPHIERALGTFSHDLVELLDGFIGHNVAERKAIEARQSFADKLMKRGEVIEIRMSSEEFQRFCDRWCEDVYENRAHDGLHGKTPFQAAAEWPGEIRRIKDERALDVLLAPAGMATVQKKGIQRDNAFFIAPELGNAIGARVGDRVEIREDEHDLGRIYVFGGDDLSFICIAECPERTGMDRREVAIKAREKQKQRVQEERAALRAIAKTVKTDDIVTEILEDRASKAGKLAMLPRKAEAHDTPELRAASSAASARTSPESLNRAGMKVQPPDARTQEILHQIEQGKSAEIVPMPRAPRAHSTEADVQRRFTRARSLEERLAAGQPIGDQDQRWLTSYQETAEYRGQLRFLQSFGEYGNKAT